MSTFYAGDPASCVPEPGSQATRPAALDTMVLTLSVVVGLALHYEHDAQVQSAAIAAPPTLVASSV